MPPIPVVLKHCCTREIALEQKQPYTLQVKQGSRGLSAWLCGLTRGNDWHLHDCCSVKAPLSELEVDCCQVEVQALQHFPVRWILRLACHSRIVKMSRQESSTYIVFQATTLSAVLMS